MAIPRRQLLGAIVLVASVDAWSAEHAPESVLNVELCDLMRDRPKYDHKRVQLRALISHGFEDFSLFDPMCEADGPIWLEYGGSEGSGTIYCCEETLAVRKKESLEIDGIRVDLVEDAQFKALDELIQSESETTVRATLVGRFFAGQKWEGPKETRWVGYGHMGFYSLLAIERVISVDQRDRADLDYRLYADQPEMNGVGCASTDLLPSDARADWITAQKSAEADGVDWVFENPSRVAVVALSKAVGLTEASLSGVHEVRRSAVRVVYSWERPEAKKNYFIVVSKPYWLSLYAKDSTKVRWTVIGLKEWQCPDEKVTTPP